MFPSLSSPTHHLSLSAGWSIHPAGFNFKICTTNEKWEGFARPALHSFIGSLWRLRSLTGLILTFSSRFLSWHVFQRLPSGLQRSICGSEALCEHQVPQGGFSFSSRAFANELRSRVPACLSRLSLLKPDHLFCLPTTIIYWTVNSTAL